MRIFFNVLLIFSLLGISACNFHTKDWKTFALGILFAIGNILIFMWR